MPSSPTAPIESDLRAARRARLGRRIGVTLLAVLVLAGLSGMLGARTASVAAEGHGYRLEVRYPKITRGGLAIAWEARVIRAGGFGGPVTIATTLDYMDLFDHNAMDPEPSAERIRGDLIEWEFDPPAGEVLTVSIDARVEPARQSGGSATTAVVIADRIVLSVDYRTIIMP